MKKFTLFLCAFALILCASGPAAADTMPLDGTWIVLDEVMSEGDFFTGNWDWNSTESVLFDITDLYVVGDEFAVYDNNALVFSTPDLPDWNDLGLGAFESPPYTTDPDTAWEEDRFSSGSWWFGAGSHSITIAVLSIPTFDGEVDFSDATVAFRATVPEPTTMLLLGIGLVGLAGLGRRKFIKK